MGKRCKAPTMVILKPAALQQVLLLMRGNMLIEFRDQRLRVDRGHEKFCDWLGDVLDLFEMRFLNSIIIGLY